MVIVAIVNFPTESAKELGQAFIKTDKEMPMPDFITRSGPFVTSNHDDGHQAIVIYSCDNSRLAEAIRAAEDRMATYIGIEGLAYSIQVWSEAEEYLKTIGVI